MRTRLLILLFFLLCACGRETVGDYSGSVIGIDLLSESKTTAKKLSDFVDDIEYIPLQTTKQSLIAEVQKIVYVGNRYYIYNAIVSDILCFDINGKFLFKLNEVGRGPGENTGIMYFDVSSDNKYLTVLNLTFDLNVYRISETGFTYERTIPLGKPYPWKLSTVPETDKLFLAVPPFTGDVPYLSMVVDMKGDTIHKKPNCYKGDYGVGGISQHVVWTYSVDNDLCFREKFSDTVFFYDVAGNSFVPRIIFNTNGTLVSPQMIGLNGVRKNHSTSIEGISETSRYIYYFYTEYINGTREEKGALFDKKTKTKYGLDINAYPEIRAGVSVNLEKTRLKDDLGGGPDLYQRIDIWDRFCSGGRLFCCVEAITLKQYVNSEEFRITQVADPKKKEELKKLADSLEENDNPVLIVITPKD